MNARLRILVFAVPVVLLFAAGFVVARTMEAQGKFDAVPPNTKAACRAITATGPEDMAFDSVSGQLFISERDIRKPRAKPSPDDGLYALTAAKTDAVPVKVPTGLSDFHPHGISLYRDTEDNLTLMAVNHRADKKETVEIFDVAATPDGVQLFHRTTVESGLFKSLNDVVAVAKTRFYATNDNGSETAWGHWLESNLLLGRAKLIYYDDGKASVAAEGLRTGNGVNVSPDGTKIYVAEMNGRRIHVFARDQFSGLLTEPKDNATFALPLNIDNLEVMANGSIIATGHPRIGLSRAHWAAPEQPAPSAAYQVTVKDGMPVSASLLFGDDGVRISASSIAVRAGQSLFVGSAFSKKFLNCRI